MCVTENEILTSEQGAVYGKCVAANYQNIKKDMCAREFLALKDCYIVRFGKRSSDSNANAEVESRGQKVIACIHSATILLG